MLDRGLLTINDDDPLNEQTQPHQLIRDRKNEQFMATVQQTRMHKVKEDPPRTPTSAPTGALPIIELSNVKVEQELMEQINDDEQDESEEEHGKKLPQILQHTPSILKTSLLAGAAATLASLTSAPGSMVQLTTGTKIQRLPDQKNTATEMIVKPVSKTFCKAFNTATLINTSTAVSTTTTTFSNSLTTTSTATMENKRLSETRTASEPIYASTSFLQNALMSGQLNISTSNTAKRQQQQQPQQQMQMSTNTHPVHVLKSAMTLASLSEIASARQEQEIAEQQYKPQQQLAEEIATTSSVLQICSCHANKTNAGGAELLPTKTTTTKTTTATETIASFRETIVDGGNKYQATSTQTIKMPIIRTATATTQTQTDELLEMPIATRMPKLLTIEKSMATIEIPTSTTKCNKSTLSVVQTQTTKPVQPILTTIITTAAGTRTSATTTTTTTIAAAGNTATSTSISSSSSLNHVKMTAVSLPKQHLTQTIPSMPSTTMLTERNQAHQATTLNTNRFSALLTTPSETHLCHQSQQQQQQQQQHQHQQHETVAPTSTAAVTVVVFKTMLPDD